MKHRFFATVMLTFVAASVLAQSLGEFKPSDTSYGLNKIGKSKTKSIYIAGFDVNFQVYNEKQDYKQGGAQFGGGMRGEALAEVSVGLEGLDEKTVQEITDKLYKEYIEKLQASGLTIIGADEASKTDSYDGFMRVKGGTVTMAEIPGVMSCSPTGYEYFIKDVNKDGKAKKGGFLGNQASMYPKLSKELGDAVIGTVDLTVLFISEQEGFKGNGAKVKVKTSLRLIGREAVTMTSDAKVKMKGQNEIQTVVSDVGFYHGKVGAGATSVYQGTLSRPLAILDVIDDEKISSFARGGVHLGLQQFMEVNACGMIRLKMRRFNVDPGKYQEGCLCRGIQIHDTSH